MSLAGLLAVGLAVGLEAVVAEPPTRFHPVAWFGRLVGPVDRQWNRPLVVGTITAVAFPGGSAVVVWGLVRLARRADPVAGGLAAGVVLFLTTSLRRLLAAARTVIDASNADPETARARLPVLAGRDPEPLSPAQLRSAAVESAAENLSDGLIAPLAAFVLGAAVSLPIAAGLAWWVKGVNTMDSMLGYRSKRVGTPSARLDDLVMAVPARITAAVLVAAAGRPGTLRRLTRPANEPSSPNAGWPMAAVAATTGVALHKPGAYRLSLGPELPSVDAASRGVRLVRRAGVVAYLGAGLIVGWLA